MDKLNLERIKLLSILKQYNRTVIIKLKHREIVSKYNKLNLEGIHKKAMIDNEFGKYAVEVRNILVSVDGFINMNPNVKIGILFDLGFFEDND